jgi:hypothetical protein
MVDARSYGGGEWPRALLAIGALLLTLLVEWARRGGH